MRLFRVVANNSIHKTSILNPILNHKGSNIKKRIYAFNNDQNNQRQVKQLKQQCNTEDLLRFAERSITYGEYSFVYPGRGYGVVPELQSFTPVGIWSMDHLRDLFDEQLDEVEFRKSESTFRRDTEEMMDKAQKLYPNKITKKTSSDKDLGSLEAGPRRMNEKATIDDLRKMSNQKFKIFKKNLKSSN